MPANEQAFPVGATGIKLVDADDAEYPIVVGTDTFTRAGKDGAEVILPLFHGDNFVGEVPEGHWKKGWDANISTFVAKIASGVLQLSGVAAVAGAGGYGWVNSQLPLPLLDGIELTTEMEVPVSDTGAAADRDILLRFYLKKPKNVTNPGFDADSLAIIADVDENGLVYQVGKAVGSAFTSLWQGSDYAKAARSPTAEKFTIWRLVFTGKPGATGAHVHVYLKQGVDRATAITATEHEVTDSPLDLSGLAFSIAYPAWSIYTQNATYFAAGNEASTGIQVTYPTFTAKYSLADANEGLGDCRVYDTMGSAVEAEWQRVLDVDHAFTGDCVVQNGLIRVYVDKDVIEGVIVYYWSGAAWVRDTIQFRLYQVTSAFDLRYPGTPSINSISPEKISLAVKVRDSATEDEDYYANFNLIIERGRFSVEYDLIDTYPNQELQYYYSVMSNHFAYAQGVAVGDSDIAVSKTDTAMLDNFLIRFDEGGLAVLDGFGMNEKPNGVLKLFQADGFARPVVANIAAADIALTKIYQYVVPFSLVANLFKEAEAATISAAARLYMDGAGEDTVTEGQAVWAATTNCAVDVNDATQVSVGAKDMKITSLAAGNVVATCTPAAPLGKLTKFDLLKLYLGSVGVASVNIYLVDADGDSVGRTQAIGAGPTQYLYSLPHSSTDMQGWSENGTYNWSTFTKVTITWAAAGINENVFIDGLHFYIGTTTARGRGETLSGGSAVVLDATNESLFNSLTGITHLTIGRYLVILRAKDTDQAGNDLQFYAHNPTDGRFLNQEQNGAAILALTSSFAYYARVIDISSLESGDTISVPYTYKSNAAENTIFVDYFLIVPIGNGQDWPQDLSHSALRTASRARRVLPV